MQDYDLGEPLDVNDDNHPQKLTMELGPRDRLSQAFEQERERGGTLKGEYGDYVHLDIRHMGEKKIDKRIPFVRELCKNYVGIDPVYNLIPVRPVVHYVMGGIHTNIYGETPLPGLFAAGECACVSINGANRLGSNSLTELLVFGARAARAAVKFCNKSPVFDRKNLLLQGKEEQERIRERYLKPRKGKETIASLRVELKSTMDSGAGIYRNRNSLIETCDKIRELKKRCNNIQLFDHSLTFNTELTTALELEYMLDIAETLSHSALARKESRGSHQRVDYPKRDDHHF